MLTPDIYGLSLAAALGAVMVASSVPGLLNLFRADAKQQRGLQDSLILLILFVFSTGLLLALKRYSGTENELYSIVPHYRQYSVFALAICYAYWVSASPFRQRIWTAFALPISLLYCFLTNLSVLPTVWEYLGQLEADRLNYRHSGKTLYFPRVQGESEYVRSVGVMAWMKQKGYFDPGIYKVDEKCLRWGPPICGSTNQEVAAMRISFDRLPEEMGSQQPNYLVVRSGNSSYFLYLANRYHTWYVTLRSGKIRAAGADAYLFHGLPRSFGFPRQYSMYVWEPSTNKAWPVTLLRQ